MIGIAADADIMIDGSIANWSLDKDLSEDLSSDTRNDKEDEEEGEANDSEDGEAQLRLFRDQDRYLIGNRW